MTEGDTGAEAAVCAGAAAADEPIIISDAVADVLLQNLASIEAEYERTIVAERRAGDAQPADGCGDDGGGAESDCEDEGAGDRDGYVALESDEDDGEWSGWQGGPDTGVAADSTDDRGELADDGPEAGQQLLENFAEFGASNPALPPPPPELNPLQATPLTDEEVDVIKDTMSKVNITPPPWARQIPDDKLLRMVQEMARTER
mmetsp:Transcript_119207/g.337962  ORF Transcript_119207/g.337962 Transcript_119207/m.337962 type:complete len:203 (+) Transcript_119207:164-772(+)